MTDILEVRIQHAQWQIEQLFLLCTRPVVTFKENDPTPSLTYRWEPASAEIVYLTAVESLRELYELKYGKETYGKETNEDVGQIKQEPP